MEKPIEGFYFITLLCRLILNISCSGSLISAAVIQYVVCINCSLARSFIVLMQLHI